ncbi:putative 4-hydroxy-2-oxoglutarate aldolase [Fusarium oxysporum f. sp. albedinis]|nr:putative 4-hydroxy-2-oxoglutarate aldolase [Fusarium oxysporum f. sp. albedinis]
MPPQEIDTSYWALAFPGFVLSALGPDMSFAAASMFITPNVPKTHQGPPYHCPEPINSHSGCCIMVEATGCNASERLWFCINTL